MQLPAFFGHKRSINLLPRDSFESSQLGIILEWALAFGKWAVIITQLVVMAAFLWRFGLDRKLTDLRKSIASDVAVVKSYDQVERDYILAQKRIQFAKPVIMGQSQVQLVLAKLSQDTPIDVWYERLSISNGAVTFTADAGSLNGFGQLLTSLQQDPMFTSVSVAKIQDGGAANAQIQFDVTLTYKNGAAKQ